MSSEQFIWGVVFLLAVLAVIAFVARPLPDEDEDDDSWDEPEPL